MPEGLFGRLQPADGLAVGGLGVRHHGLQRVTGLLGLGQALAQLVVLALHDQEPGVGPTPSAR